MNHGTLNLSIREFQKESEIGNQIYELLTTVDQEFSPPISSYGPLIDYVYNEDSLILYLERGSKVIGYLRFYLEHYQYDCPYIRTIAIDPEYRGKGYSKTLLRACLDYIKLNKYSRVAIKTWSKNKISIKLYQSMDFMLQKVIKNDRGNGLDTYVFEAKI